MTKQSPEPRPASITTPGPSTVLMIFRTIADTTWRIFVPVILLLLAGFFIDVRLGTKPWVMLVGVVLGAALAAWLVRLQYVRDSKTGGVN